MLGFACMGRSDRPHLRPGPLIAALSLAAVALVWCALTYRPVSHLSSYFFLILLNGEMYYEPFRQLGALPQVPAFLLSRLDGSANWTREILLSWSLCYSLHPLASLIVCWAICARARAHQMLLFPLFSFAAATLMTMGLPCSEVVMALSVFWPLFLLQWIGRHGPSRTAGILLGSAALAFTHELACLFFGVLAIAAVVRMKEKKHRGTETAFAILFGAAALWLAVRGYTYPGKIRMFQRSIAGLWGPAAWAAVVASVTFVTFRGRSWILAGGWAASVLVYALIVFRDPSSASIEKSFHLRILAPPLASLIALAALRAHRMQAQAWAALSWFTAAVLLQGAVIDLAMTKRWSTGVANLKTLAAATDGSCSLLSDLEYERSLRPFEVYDATVPSLSILFQETRRPMVVLGVRSWTEGRLGVDFCHEISKGKLHIFPEDSLPLQGGGYLDFSALTSKLNG